MEPSAYLCLPDDIRTMQLLGPLYFSFQPLLLGHARRTSFSRKLQPHRVLPAELDSASEDDLYLPGGTRWVSPDHFLCSKPGLRSSFNSGITGETEAIQYPGETAVLRTEPFNLNKKPDL